MLAPVSPWKPLELPLWPLLNPWIRSSQHADLRISLTFVAVGRETYLVYVLKRAIDWREQQQKTSLEGRSPV